MNKKNYQEILVETFIPDKHEHTDAKVRVRPVADQGYDVNTRVECSRKIREEYPVGTKFKIRAKETMRQGGSKFLYSHHSWPVEVIEKT
jgi:hypothetical protein